VGKIGNFFRDAAEAPKSHHGQEKTPSIISIAASIP